MFEKIAKAIRSIITSVFPREVGSFIKFVDLAEENKSSIEIKPINEPITVANTTDANLAVVGWRYFVRLAFVTKDGVHYVCDRACEASSEISGPIFEKRFISKINNQAKVILNKITVKWPNVSAKIVKT